MRCNISNPQDWSTLEIAELTSVLRDVVPPVFGNSQATFAKAVGNIRIMSDAVSNSQDDEYKLGCFITLGKIAIEMDKLEIAAEHVALAKAVRAANNWSISPDLAQLEQSVMKAFKDANVPFPSLPSDVKELSKICHQRWREGASEGLEFVKGTLKPFDPNKSFAFIKPDDGKEDVFVLLRSIPRNCAKEGARLEFILEKSFDQKKNRESTQATKVRCVNK